MLESAICNENGAVVAWCCDLTDDETQAMLDSNENYYLNCLERIE